MLAACGGDSGNATDGTANADENLQVIPINARQWAYSPNQIALKQHVAVILELTSSDVHHGFNVPDFGVRADIIPGMKTRVRVTPDKAGTFDFFCDYYCGSGHEGMDGKFVVE